MRPWPVLLLALVLSACNSSRPVEPVDEPDPFPAGWTLVDLTLPLDGDAPFVDHGGAFPFERIDLEGEGWSVGAFSVVELCGTHVAAPATLVEGGATIDAFGTSDAGLLCALVVLDAPADGRPLAAAGVQAHVRRWGPIPAGSAVVVRRSGGTASNAGFAVDAVELLAARYRVRLIGTDGPAIDVGPDAAAAPAQRAAAAAGVWCALNLAELAGLPERGAQAMFGALPVRGGSGSPARVVALVPPELPEPLPPRVAIPPAGAAPPK